jgi:hypothetical protein
MVLQVTTARCAMHRQGHAGFAAMIGGSRYPLGILVARSHSQDPIPRHDRGAPARDDILYAGCGKTYDSAHWSYGQALRHYLFANHV